MKVPDCDQTNGLLFWVDLETTGLDPHLDSIIEFAGILTTTNLEPVGTIQFLTEPSPRAVHRMMNTPEVRDMHTSNGLIDAVLHRTEGPLVPILDAQTQVVEFLNTHVPDGTHIRLAGSGVAGFDMVFLRTWMPKVTDRLADKTFDIGILRIAYRMWAPDLPVSDAPTRKTHRALDDIRCHLDEATEIRIRIQQTAALSVPC